MTIRKITIAFAITAALVGETAQAGQSASAWGTLGNGGGRATAISSAQLHQLEDANAQAATIGNSVTTMYRSITSCGYCVYNQITGNDNSINGNTISGSNSGTVTSNGTFKN